MVAIGEIKLLNMSTEFSRLFERANKIAQDSLADSEECLKETGLSQVDLKEQLASMRNFYLKPENAPTTPHYDDEICEVLLAADALCTELDKWLSGGIAPRGAWGKLKEFIAGKTSGRIGRHATPSSLSERLDKLFKLSGQRWEQWIAEDGSFTEHFKRCAASYHLREAKIAKFGIWKLLMNRSLELNTLHGSSTLGTAKSGQLLGSIKRGRKKIDNEIEKYNKLIQKLGPSNSLSPLDNKKVHEMLLTDDFWDLDHFHSREKWAVDPNVRKAINKRQLFFRAIEEIHLLTVELQRYVNWCSNRIRAVKHSLQVIPVGSPIGRRLLETGCKTGRALQNLRDSDLGSIRVSINNDSIRRSLVKSSQVVEEAMGFWEGEISLLTNVSNFDLGNSTESLEALALKISFAEELSIEDEQGLSDGDSE